MAAEVTANEWDSCAADWDTQESVKLYAERAHQSLLSNDISVTGLRVLDFGCGTGLLTAKIAESADEVVALDASSKMVEKLQDKHIPNVRTLCEILSRSLAAEHCLLIRKFDLIVASSVCAFLPDFEESLAAMCSLLRPSGRIIQWDWLDEGGSNASFGLTKERIRAAYTNAGLHIQSISIPFSMDGDNGAAPMQVVMVIASLSK